MLHYDNQLRTIRLNDYNTFFHFKIEPHTDFGPLLSKNHRLRHKTHADSAFSEHTG
jgi:hypothetical protein